MILIRIILIFLIIFLIVRYAIQALGTNYHDKPVSGPGNNDQVKSKKISKKVGEYIDYEEIDD